jgi:hypothetical protein
VAVRGSGPNERDFTSSKLDEGPSMSHTKMLTAFAILVGAAASPAHAQNPNWPLDLPFMPQRGRIGVQVEPMTPELREHFGAPGDHGLLVIRVEPDRPAAQGDVRVGDVIIAADDAPMREPFDLTRAVGRVPAGGELQLRIVRDKHEHTTTVRPEGEPALWLDPDRWGQLVEKGLHGGDEELRRRLDALERRLEELERKLQQKQSPGTGDRT